MLSKNDKRRQSLIVKVLEAAKTVARMKRSRGIKTPTLFVLKEVGDTYD